MRIPRFHLDRPLHAGAELELDAGAARHARKVLRLRAGAPVEVFDGRGAAHAAEVVALARDGARVRLGAALADDREAPLEAILALGIARGERMDFALQKAAELGVSAVVPLLTERGVVRLDAARAARRRAHWHAVAVSACEQCGRNRVPEVAPVATLAEWLETEAGDGLCLMPDPRSERNLSELGAPAPRSVRLLIGPEGGLSEPERAHALRHGFQSVRLGPRILRVETAVVATLAAVMTLWGDLAG